MRGPVFTAHLRAAPALALACAASGWLGLATLAGCIPTAPNLEPGAETLPCTGPACVPLNGGAPVTTAPTVNCTSAEQGLDFAPFSVLDSEEIATTNGITGNVAQYFYQYVDGTAGLTPSAYQPFAIAADRCQETPTGQNHVYHTSGGPFTGWGGGIGIAMAHINSDSGVCTGLKASICPSEGGLTTDTPCLCPPLTATDPTAQPELGAREIAGAALDVSQWDGISLWARRGPNSQPLMRVLVGDKYTDDDISYLMYVDNPTALRSERYCERKADCGCNFQDAVCSFYSSDPTTDPMYNTKVIDSDMNFPDPDAPGSFGALYCGAPESHPGSASQNLFSNNGLVCGETKGCASNFCGESVCDAPYSAYATGPDAQFVNKPCTTYTYRNGTQSNVCYDPAKDPPPPEGDEQCGDHFTFPINLSTEWQFYQIPFTEMFQQGWAKQAPTFDLRSVSVVRFTWDVGYIDYYIDDVKFYRTHRGSSDAGTP